MFSTKRFFLCSHFSGKVILHSTYGDISIELWPKEAPKACRNFIQLCMEGYYNETIFHRIVAGFIIQGGDPEGTGLGGESCLDGGKPFQDEFHSRLRFVRRGLVAMANSGVPNDNKSQFFITLDATMELQNKHTIFGKVQFRGVMFRLEQWLIFLRKTRDFSLISHSFAHILFTTRWLETPSSTC
jgi:cyclophilin family peptidyl-prolyl cis-trans isomerase